MVVHNGHRLAMSLAARRFSTARALSEEWSGVHQLQTIKSLADGPTDADLERLSADVGRLGRRVLNRCNFSLAVIGETDAVRHAPALVGELVTGLPMGEAAGFAAPETALAAGRIREGWSTASAVNFVAAAFPAVRMEHADSAALAVIAKLLRSLYLHREIREKGGAYGGFALYNPEDGTFSLASYRDPHIVETLEVFQGAAGFISGGTFNDTDVKEAVLQVCSEIDKPDPPGPAARKAFYRKIIHLSDELREGFKQRLIALTRREVLAAAERYFGGGLQHCSVAVIGSEESLRAANAKLSGAAGAEQDIKRVPGVQGSRGKERKRRRRLFFYSTPWTLEPLYPVQLLQHLLQLLQGLLRHLERVLGAGELHVHYFRLVGFQRIQDDRPDLGVLLHELGHEPVEKTDHVVGDENLTVHIRPGADPDDRHLDRFGHELARAARARLPG